LDQEEDADASASMWNASRRAVMTMDFNLDDDDEGNDDDDDDTVDDGEREPGRTCVPSSNATARTRRGIW